DANIKLDSVLSDLMGKSGRAMIEALIAGETNPATLAGLADRRVKASPDELREALRGRTSSHGLEYVRATMRVPASVGPTACGTVRASDATYCAAASKGSLWHGPSK